MSKAKNINFESSKKRYLHALQVNKLDLNPNPVNNWKINALIRIRCTQNFTKGEGKERRVREGKEGRVAPQLGSMD